MFKTFFLSPVAGLACGSLGWLAALGVKNAMDEARFADLRFGWEGAMVGGVALAVIMMVAASGESIDRVIVTLFAAVSASLHWNLESIPFDAFNVRRDVAASYWFTVSTAVAILVLLLMGLRAARETNNRARG